MKYKILDSPDIIPLYALCNSVIAPSHISNRAEKD